MTAVTPSRPSRNAYARPMRLAIADPPYLGAAVRRYGHQHPEAARWDTEAAHLELLDRLTQEFDGWAYACTTPMARLLLPAAPPGHRLGLWHKPRSGSYPNTRISYAHELVIFVQPPGRRGGIAHQQRADVLTAVHSARNRGTVGAKPPAWTRWVLDLIGYQPGTDEIADLFPGSGLVAEEIERYRPGCAHCGAYLPATTRADARFCSTRCRVAAHRARQPSA